MEVVAPASLQTAINTAPLGETIAVAGTFRENLKIGKAGIKLIPKDGAPATIVGRIWIPKTGADVSVRGLTLDGRNTGNLPSWTTDAPRVQFTNNECTNGNTAIGFNTTNWDGGVPDDVVIENNWIHHIGVMPPANHDHGVYIAAGQRVRVRHNLIHDCADRGIQVYSYAQAHDALIEFNLVAYCGQGIIIGGGEAGEPSSRTLVRRNIVAFPQTARAGYEEWWNYGPAGTGNRIEDNILWDPPDQRQDPLTGVTVSGMKVIDPMFTNPTSRDFRLRAGSPAVGYGPARIQPTTPPAPTPDRAQILADARAHMLKTTILYSTWRKRLAAGYYAHPELTEWAKAEALLDQLR